MYTKIIYLTFRFYWTYIFKNWIYFYLLNLVTPHAKRDRSKRLLA